MKDTLTENNSGDFKQRYEHTFGWYLGNETPLLVFIEYSDSEQVKFTDVKGNTFIAYANSDIQFEFIPLNKGFFQLKDGSVVLLERIPARQWKRGISSSNTRVTAYSINTSNSGISINTTKPFGLTLELLNEIFSSDYKLPNKFIRDKLVLSDAFAIIGHYIYVWSIKIGDYKNKVITLYTDLFLQEITDVVKRNTHEFEVLVNAAK